MKILKQVFLFYYNGFRQMTVGKSLWIIILIKLFIMFAILKLFFFEDFLNKRFETDEQKTNYITKQLTQ